MMQQTKGIVALLAFIVFMSPCVSSAEDNQGQKRNTTLGLGVGVSMSEYRGYDPTILPLPFFSYTGGRFFIRGLTGGVYLYKDIHQTFSLDLSYLPQKFDASESDDQAMRRLDDRDPSMLAGASYGLTTEFGMAKLSVSTDILGRSNGIIADASYSYPVQLNVLKITPAVGGTWTNSAYNDYYYGISASESRKSGLREYDADYAFSPYVGLNMLFNITDSVTFMIHSRVAYLSSEISDSPMVDQDYKYSFGAAVSYSF